MITHSKGNKACPDLGGSIFVLQDANGEIVNGVALLQYHISCEAKEVHFQVYFKADKVCKHSVAVAEKNEMLGKHLEQICKGLGKKESRELL
ncbi:unnamed protein product [Pocillopora meandrina]|uniref:Uncharacterized protein n=1 Tax=Pocillopora meandrina TaxID=46732 RepID=A0AAU9X019_9CNID|nr:unnamed protein product [Pocillopora meandrina]